MIYVQAAHCLNRDCPWIADGQAADREAEKHTKATGHATVSSTARREP